jgi:hypothetical protein
MVQLTAAPVSTQEAAGRAHDMATAAGRVSAASQQAAAPSLSGSHVQSAAEQPTTNKPHVRAGAPLTATGRLVTLTPAGMVSVKPLLPVELRLATLLLRSARRQAIAVEAACECELRQAGRQAVGADGAGTHWHTV